MNFKNLSKLQIVVILGGILLTVLLLLAPKKGAPVKQEAELNNENNSLQSFVDSLKTVADKGLIALLAEQENGLSLRPLALDLEIVAPRRNGAFDSFQTQRPIIRQLGRQSTQ